MTLYEYCSKKKKRDSKVSFPRAEFTRRARETEEWGSVNASGWKCDVREEQLQVKNVVSLSQSL